MDDLDAFARLNARIENLEHRVCALEHPAQMPEPGATPKVALAGFHPMAHTVPLTPEGGILPVAGKAMLGIAGAYLLRAVAESGSLPKMAVVLIALCYAGMWLVWAARAAAEANFASAIYASTTALILAPMLWELTLRFQVLPASASAGIVAGYAVSAFALSWKRVLTALVWVSSLAAAVTALALLVATHDLVPFVSALLVMALASEIAAWRGHWPSLRPLIAAAADFAVWILLFIYSGTDPIPSDYKVVANAVLLAVPCALFLIYGGSVAFRTLGLRQRIGIVEIGQTVIAFLLAAFGILRLGGGNASRALGIICLLFSAGCYAAAYGYFERVAERFPESRNFHVYATWSAALFLTGCFLCFPPVPLALCLSAAAVVATMLGVRASRLTLEFHGLVSLTGAAYASGLLGYAGRALAGAFPAVPGWTVWIVAASAVLCYVVGGRFRTERWDQHFAQVLLAILAVAAVVIFLVSVLVWLAQIGMTTGDSQVAVIRTLITCAVALALAFAGSRWQRSELVWIAYGTLALVTAKLLFEDLRNAHPGSTAASIFLYAVALILVPRMVRVGRRLEAR